MTDKYSKYINDGTPKCEIEFGNKTLLDMFIDHIEDYNNIATPEEKEMYNEILNRMNSGTGWIECDCGEGWIPHKDGKSRAGDG